MITADARGVNGHKDHVAVHWAVRRALEAHPKTRLALLAYPPEVSETALPRLIFPTAEAEIDASLTLSDSERDTKEACLRVHEALVTLSPDGDDSTLVVRPPVEHYDLLGESHAPRLVDLFTSLPV